MPIKYTKSVASAVSANELWRKVNPPTDNNIELSPGVDGINASLPANDKFRLLLTELAGANYSGVAYEDTGTGETYLIVITDDLGKKVRISAVNPPDYVNIEISPTLLQIVNGFLELSLDTGKLEVKDAASAPLFAINDSGEILTNQAEVNPPGSPANVRVPLYDTTGTLLGYIDLNN
ncbi:MAG TPA: hypothetical protein PKL45_15030 [Bacteroidia bacterium]|nr:hypothetical protein [Bacteroidia bacterium]